MRRFDARELAAVAARQYGHLTRRQLLDLGVSQGAINYWLKIGKLIRVHTGVYALGYRPRGPVARAAGAVLACGDGAALSHASGACLWGLWKTWPATPEVTVAADRHPSGVWVHSVGKLARTDVRNTLGIRVISPARTVLDMTSRLTDAAVMRMVNDARRSGHLRQPELWEVCERLRHQRGAKRLGALTGECDLALTRSEFEDAFLAFCERFGLPRPRVNVRVAGHEADAVFVAERVIVELDGYDFHRDREAFERDRDRDVDALLIEFVTVRVTWDRLTYAAEREARRLRALLRIRRRLNGPS